MEATISSKGQVTLPKPLRDAMHLKAGDKLIFEETDEGGFFVTPRLTDVRSLRGMIKYTGRPITIEEMNQGIADHIAESC